MMKALALIGFGFVCAMIGIGHIGISVAMRTRISDGLEWVCLVGFVGFMLSGIVIALLRAADVNNGGREDDRA